MVAELSAWTLPSSPFLDLLATRWALSLGFPQNPKFSLLPLPEPRSSILQFLQKAAPALVMG